MYKSKYQAWLIVIGLYLVIMFFAKVVFKEKTVYSLSSSIGVEFTDRLDGYKKKSSEINVIKDNADIILEKHSDKEIEGYTKYENQLYSEFIVFLQTEPWCGTNCELYSSAKYYINDFNNLIDLKTLFEYFEEDKSYADLGLPKLEAPHDSDKETFDLNKKIEINIPGNGTYYHNEFKELVAYCLNDYSYENIDDSNLQERVNNIIVKAKKYNSELELQTKIFKNASSDNRGIFIAPSYIKDEPSISSRQNSYYYYLAFHPYKTTSIYYDIYTKNVNEDNYYDRFFYSLTKEKFFNETGLKNKDIDFGINHYGYNIYY